MRRQGTLDLWTRRAVKTPATIHRATSQTAVFKPSTSAPGLNGVGSQGTKSTVIEVTLIDSPTKPEAQKNQRREETSQPDQNAAWSNANFFDEFHDEMLNAALRNSLPSENLIRRQAASNLSAPFVPSSSFFKDDKDADQRPSTSIVCDSKPRGTAPCPPDGFDPTAGQTWIYPTNRPFRQYQHDISRTCLFHNTLVTLPTGLGKTFIAAVVMYNFYRWYPEGKIIFMAPTKPLVAQQIAACYEVMAIPQEDMSEMTGSMQPNDRIVKWTSKRMFFMTPQVLSNDLVARGSEIQAHKIKCVVFDEAHKATGNFAYCQVIRELLQYTKQFRVLALSATPGKDTTIVQQVISNLLIAKLELRSENSPEILEFSHAKNIEKIVVYRDDTMKHLEELYIKVLEKYVEPLNKAQVLPARDIRNYEKFSLLQARDRMRTSGHAKNFGRPGQLEYLFAASMSLCHGLELLLLHGQRTCYSFLKGLVNDDQKVNNPRLRSELSRDEDFGGFMEILDEKFGQIHDGYTQATRAEDMTLSHPKLRRLVDLLLDHFKIENAAGEDNSNDGASENQQKLETRVMIFSQYRDSVEEIASVLRKYSPTIKPMKFVGQSSNGSSGSKGFTQKEQLKVVKEFKSGNYNTLVATCVGEEGLDIVEVDLIVCYDSPKSPIRMVQRMGRTGRKRVGRIVVLLTEGKEEQIYKRSESQKMSIYRAIQQASRKFQLSTVNPRLVPPGFSPQCVQTLMRQQGPFDGLKVRRKEKASPAQFYKLNFLTDSQMNRWKSKVGNFGNLPESHVKRYALNRSLHNDSVDSRNGVNLNEFYLWQNQSQRTFIIGHSTSSVLLVESIKKCEYFNQLKAQNFRTSDFYYDDVESVNPHFAVPVQSPSVTAKKPCKFVKPPKDAADQWKVVAEMKNSPTVDRFAADWNEIEFYNLKIARGLEFEDFRAWKNRKNKENLNQSTSIHSVDAEESKKIGFAGDPVISTPPTVRQDGGSSKKRSLACKVDTFDFDLCTSIDELFDPKFNSACKEKHAKISTSSMHCVEKQSCDAFSIGNFEADFSFDFGSSFNVEKTDDFAMQNFMFEKACDDTAKHARKSSLLSDEKETKFDFEPCAKFDAVQLRRSENSDKKFDENRNVLSCVKNLHVELTQVNASKSPNLKPGRSKSMQKIFSQKVATFVTKTSNEDVIDQSESKLHTIPSRSGAALSLDSRLAKSVDDWLDDDFIVPPSPPRPINARSSQSMLNALTLSSSSSSLIGRSQKVGGIKPTSLSQNVGRNCDGDLSKKVGGVDPASSRDSSKSFAGSQSPIFSKASHWSNSKGAPNGKPLATIRPFRINDTVVEENVIKLAQRVKRRRPVKYGENQFIDAEANVSRVGCSNEISSDESSENEPSPADNLNPDDWFLEDSFVDIGSQPEYFNTQRKIDSPTQMQAVYLKSMNNSMSIGRRDKFKLVYEKVVPSGDWEQCPEDPGTSGHRGRRNVGVNKVDMLKQVPEEDEDYDGPLENDSFVVPNDFVEYMTQDSQDIEIIETKPGLREKNCGNKKMQRLRLLSDSE